MYDVCNNNKQGGLAGQIGTDVCITLLIMIMNLVC